jgi:hypothetical protein
MRLRIEPPPRPLPPIRWKWDPETDILSGTFDVAPDAHGLTSSLEIADGAGTVLVCDVTRGVLCGLDVVVWPDVEVDADLRLPDGLPEGTLVVATDDEEAVPSVDLEEPIMVHASLDETLFHVALGDREVVRRLRLADRLVVELDGDGALAGFWLIGVPPYEPPDDDDF